VNPNTKLLASKILKGRYFSKCVDLGCGEGYYGDLLKNHCSYLIGVDHNYPRLGVAKEFGGYDEVVLSEVQNYSIPYDVDAIFMFDVIEHLPKTDGFDLLLNTRRAKFTLLTTPAVFHTFLGIRNRHQSFWTEKELQENSFQTLVYNSGIFGFFLNEIIAWRESSDVL